MLKKRIISVILILCLLTGICSFAMGDEISDTSTITGNDVVVVLDMTNSMGKADRDGNDRYGYRIDATAMLIGMLDMDGSRVAVIPFDGTPGKHIPITELTEITDSQVRANLINYIYDNYKEVYPDTNIGSALMKANQILLDRENKTNRPMIVVMSDGMNSYSKPVTVQESLRWKDGQIIDEGRATYNTEKADIITKEAYECAKANDIPIYTVALGYDPSRAPASGKGISLQDISLGTSRMESLHVEKDNAKDLPGFFAQVLAKQIGSSVQMSAKPVRVEGTANQYEVKIPILNENILEANIILPVKTSRVKYGTISGIDPSSLELVDSTGIRKNGSDDVSIYHGADRSHFSMIKIREPGNPGMWTLRFKSDSDPGEISFNILYKYNIKYNVTIESAGGSNEYYKTDTLRLIGRFVDEQGNPSTDTALYQDHTGEAGYEDWMTIHSVWKLCRIDSENNVTGDPLKEGTLDANTVQNRFETIINLGDGIVYPEGDYMLVVTAAGAGLERRVEIPLHLKNHAPVATEYSQTIDVNSIDEGREDTWTVEGTSGELGKRADEIVTDADHDDVQFDLRPVGDAQSIATLTLNPETKVISYQTIQSGEGIKAGTATYELSYNDLDGGIGSVQVTLKINSLKDIALDKYDLEVNIEGKNTASGTDSYLKNTPLKITARLKEKETGVYADSSILEKLKRKIQISSSTGENLAGDGTMAVAGDALEFTVESTGNRKSTWNIVVEVDPFEPVHRTITIPNDHAPQSVPQEEVTINCSGDKIPGFLSFFGKDTEEDDLSRKVDVKELFTDDDGETDTLAYSEPFFVDPGTGETTAENIIYTTDDDNGVYTIHVSGEGTGLFRYSMKSDMHLTATDGDGEKTDFVRTVTIVDLYNKLITIVLLALIAIIILIILILIIHQIRKPRFPKLNMTIREEPSLYESGSETLSPVKTPTNANAVGVDADMAAKHNISMELLQNIIIRPIRSTTSVGVYIRKPFTGHEVMLGDIQLKAKKKYTWAQDEELSIRSLNGEGLVAIKLEDRRDEEGTDPAGEFGGDDEWATVAQEQGTKAANRRHSRKVDRKQPAEPVEPETSDKDDFDF